MESARTGRASRIEVGHIADVRSELALFLPHRSDICAVLLPVDTLSTKVRCDIGVVAAGIQRWLRLS